MKKNIGENCFCELEEDRYHETDCDKWKPYKNCPTITNILSNFNKYPIKKINYIDKETDEYLLDVAKNRQKSEAVAIVDVFSLHENNEYLASKFDWPDVPLIMPFCETLYSKANGQILQFAKKKESKFKMLKAIRNKKLSCSLYFTKVSELCIFEQHLLDIFKKMKKIKNQSITQTPIRNLSNMNFQ